MNGNELFVNYINKNMKTVLVWFHIDYIRCPLRSQYDYSGQTLLIENPSLGRYLFARKFVWTESRQKETQFHNLSWGMKKPSRHTTLKQRCIPTLNQRWFWVGYGSWNNVEISTLNQRYFSTLIKRWKMVVFMLNLGSIDRLPFSIVCTLLASCLFS